MYNNIKQLVAAATSKPLYQVIVEDEAALSQRPEEEIWAEFARRWQVMQASARRALSQPQPMIGGLISGQASRQESYGAGLIGADINHMMAMAFSSSEVNAGMGRICAAPTAGACGILPAVLLTAAERLQADEQQVLRGLVVATGIGAVITRNATVSGAEGGCQAECGTAAAMAAAGAVQMAGGSPKACAEACAIALINCMGLICDPVAGLVQLPCSFRNASQSVNALASADMALAGQSCLIPADEVIESMYKVGRRLPVEFRETALGGIAATATGKEIEKQLFG